MSIGFDFDHMGLVCYIAVVIVSTITGIWAVRAASHSNAGGIGLGLAAMGPPGILLNAILEKWSVQGPASRTTLQTWAFFLSIAPVLLGLIALYRVTLNYLRHE